MSDSGADSTEHSGNGGIKLWLLMDANRWVLAGLLLGLVGVVLIGVGPLDPGTLGETIGSKDPIETLFQAMVTAIITGVTLVVSINQLVLSQELGPAGDQRERMVGAMEFREDVEPYIESDVSPAEPSAFMHSLTSAIELYARELSAAVEELPDRSAADEISSFSDRTAIEARGVSAQFENATFGSFELVRTALQFHYSEKIHWCRRLQAEYGDMLNESQSEPLNALLETLQFFSPAREHFKTLYFQWELINLSRMVLYAAVPALTTATAMILFFDDPGSIPGTTFGVENLRLVVTVATLVSITPFMLLVSYILRITTVAKRTLAIGPFVLHAEEEDLLEETN